MMYLLPTHTIVTYEYSTGLHHYIIYLYPASEILSKLPGGTPDNIITRKLGNSTLIKKTTILLV